jgi:hypothetical protein
VILYFPFHLTLSLKISGAIPQLLPSFHGFICPLSETHFTNTTIRDLALLPSIFIHRVRKRLYPFFIYLFFWKTCNLFRTPCTLSSWSLDVCADNFLIVMYVKHTWTMYKVVLV